MKNVFRLKEWMRTFSCLIQHDFYKELPLRQGMQAMVEVVTDERRLIELLLPLSGE